MQMTSREKNAVIIAGISLVLFLFLQFLFFPLVENREKMKKNVVTRQQQLDEMEQMQQRYALFSQKSDSIAALLNERITGFSLFSFLEQNAADIKVKERIAYMKPSELTADEVLKQSMVEMKLQAVSLKQLVAFLKTTESPQNLVGIKRITIQENNKEKGTLDVILQIVSVDKVIGAVD